MSSDEGQCHQTRVKVIRRGARSSDEGQGHQTRGKVIRRGSRSSDEGQGHQTRGKVIRRGSRSSDEGQGHQTRVKVIREVWSYSDIMEQGIEPRPPDYKSSTLRPELTRLPYWGDVHTP